MLALEGYQVDDVATLAEARRILSLDTTHLLVLDLTLPDGDSLELLHETEQLPTIIITGRESEGERILGLRLGADDYLVKPFSPMELAARAEAVLRRTRAPQPARLSFGELVIDPGTREISLAGETIELTRKEFGLLAFLAEHPRQVFSRDDLRRRVWGSDPTWQTSATVTGPAGENAGTPGPRALARIVPPSARSRPSAPAGRCPERRASANVLTGRLRRSPRRTSTSCSGL